MRKTDRWIALDFVRVMAMFSVILLHTSSGFVFGESSVTLRGLSLAYLINQAVRYCVPLFFMISGLSLALSAHETSYGGFLRGRAKKIVLPYLFWTLLYFWDQMEAWSPWELIRALLLGTAAPHLYFIVALVQLYLLYFLLRRALNRRPVLTMGLAFLLSLLMQWAVYLMVFQVYLLPGAWRPYLLKTFVPWLFVFVLGMMLAKTRESWRAAALRYRWLLLAGSVAFALWYVFDSFATHSYDLSVKPVLFMYVPLVFFCLLGLGERMAAFSLLRGGIAALSGHSMTIFFCHVFMLNRLRDWLQPEGTSGFLLLSGLTIVLAVLFAFVFDAMLNGIKKVFTRV